MYLPTSFMNQAAANEGEMRVPLEEVRFGADGLYGGRVGAFKFLNW